MKNVIVIAIVFIFVAGCDQFWTGMGLGVAGSETLDSWEENLEAKRIELDQLYDKEIDRMKTATDPNELAFHKERAEQIQLARVANLGALAVIQELKPPDRQPDQQPSYLNLLHGLIPLAVAWGGNELRKRVASENKRSVEKHGRELAMRQLATMKEEDITAPVVKELIYKDIGLARRK